MLGPKRRPLGRVRECREPARRAHEQQMTGFRRRPQATTTTGNGKDCNQHQRKPDASHLSLLPRGLRA